MAESILAGIDLGTTFSVIAIVDGSGKPTAIPNAEGELTTPSVVHVTSDGTFIVGKPALAFPDDIGRIFKRYMGGEQTFLLANRRFTAEQLSVEVLRKLAADASAHLGQPVRDVVISVPAHFGQIERDATRRAGTMAGLRVLDLINEPTAAATVYAQGHQLENGYVLVFDLGGGTFDITLIEVTPSGSYVKRTGGSINLGGQNFTDGLVQMLADSYMAQHHHEIRNAARVALNQQAEAAKIALSSTTSTALVVTAEGGPALPVTLSRDDFEISITGYLFQIEAIIDSLLDKASLEPRDIRKVLLVGGSSRVPAVRAMLTQKFGQAPDESLDPDLAVAWGAALTAARYRTDESGALEMRPGDLVVGIIDSVTHAVGVKALQPGTSQFVVDHVLPHGFRLETWSEPRYYHPKRANDTMVGVEVFQGDTTDLSGCRQIGYLPIALPSGCTPENTQIAVWMRLNRSGLLEVQVGINDTPPQRAEFQTSA